MVNTLEDTLQHVNNIKVQLDDYRTKRNKELLRMLTSVFESIFKEDPFFESIYERYFFGGSFYDGLKVGKPNEFDIDLVFKLPKSANPTICTSDEYPGFVQVYIANLSLGNNYVNMNHMNVSQFVSDDGFLSIPCIMRWFQSLVQYALNKLHTRPDLGYKIGKCIVTRGPAITFQVYDIEHRQSFDVDFVPCFKFSVKQWPANCRRYTPLKGDDQDDQLVQEFLVVPKHNFCYSSTHMRLSFQGQERRLIDNKGFLKPAIRLLKLYRNNFNDVQIKSYYIKTIALWALEDESFVYYRKSLAKVFLQLFKRLMYAIKERQLPYYWNSELNFFADLNAIYCFNTHNRMMRELKAFEAASSDRSEQIVMIFTQYIPEAAWLRSFESQPIDYNDEFTSAIEYANMYKHKNSKYIKIRTFSLFYAFFKWLLLMIKYSLSALFIYVIICFFYLWIECFYRDF